MKTSKTSSLSGGSRGPFPPSSKEQLHFNRPESLLLQCIAVAKFLMSFVCHRMPAQSNLQPFIHTRWRCVHFCCMLTPATPPKPSSSSSIRGAFLTCLPFSPLPSLFSEVLLHFLTPGSLLGDKTHFDKEAGSHGTGN